MCRSMSECFGSCKIRKNDYGFGHRTVVDRATQIRPTEKVLKHVQLSIVNVFNYFLNNAYK